MLAFRHTSFANTMIIHYMSPFVVVFAGAWLLREPFSRWYVFGSVLALIGIVLGVHESISFKLNRENILGNGAAFMSVVGFSGLILMTRKIRTLEIPIGRTLFYAWLFILLIVLPLQIPFGRLSLTFNNLFYGLLCGTVGTVFVYIFMNMGMRHISAGTASIIMFSEVAFSIGVGCFGFLKREYRYRKRYRQREYLRWIIRLLYRGLLYYALPTASNMAMMF